MKKLYLLAAALLFGAATAFAQDTIVMLDGNEVVAKVDRITESAVAYHMWNYLDGPERVVSLGKIFMIKFSSGQHEVVSNINQKTYQESNGGSRADYGGVVLMRRGRYIVESSTGYEVANLDKLLGNAAYNEYMDAKSTAGRGSTAVTFGVLDAALGLGLVVAGVTDNSYGSVVAGYILAAAADILIPVGCIVSGVNKGKISRIVEDYNRRATGSLGMEVGLAPTLVCVPDAAGNRTIGLGAGLSLHF